MKIDRLTGLILIEWYEDPEHRLPLVIIQNIAEKEPGIPRELIEKRVLEMEADLERMDIIHCFNMWESVEYNKVRTYIHKLLRIKVNSGYIPRSFWGQMRLLLDIPVKVEEV